MVRSRELLVEMLMLIFFLLFLLKETRSDTGKLQVDRVACGSCEVLRFT